MVMKFSFCGAFSAASLWLAVLAHTAYAAPPSPVCANPTETCDPEDFSSYSTPSYLGTSFTSPGGFYFELVSGGGQFQVQSLANFGSALFIPGYISEMVLPVDREVVTFALTGGGYFEFYAYNSSGHVRYPFLEKPKSLDLVPRRMAASVVSISFISKISTRAIPIMESH